MAMRSVVAGVGSALPKRRIDNEELAATVDTSDQWIVERTGIRSRYVAGEGETTATLARDAAVRALEHAGIDAKDVGQEAAGPEEVGPEEVHRERRLGAVVAQVGSPRRESAQHVRGRGRPNSG